MNKNNTKSKTINFHQMPSKLWRLLKKHLPKAAKKVVEPQSVGDNSIIARSGRMAGREPPKGEAKPVGR